MANKKISALRFTRGDTQCVRHHSDHGCIRYNGICSRHYKKSHSSQLMVAASPVQSVAGKTGTVTLSNSDISGLGTAATTDSTAYATAAQGATADTALQSVSAGELTDGNFDGTSISGFDATINDQTGTAYTLLASDNGKVVVLDNGSAVTVTVPSGLGVGFNCSFVQKGAGQVTFSASSTTINNRQSHTKINGQYGVASIVAYVADTFVLAGDTAS